MRSPTLVHNMISQNPADHEREAMDPQSGSRLCHARTQVVSFRFLLGSGWCFSLRDGRAPESHARANPLSKLASFVGVPPAIGTSPSVCFSQLDNFEAFESF